LLDGFFTVDFFVEGLCVVVPGELDVVPGAAACPTDGAVRKAAASAAASIVRPIKRLLSVRAFDRGGHGAVVDYAVVRVFAQKRRRPESHRLMRLNEDSEAKFPLVILVEVVAPR
jgi:hypothetical protein